MNSEAVAQEGRHFVGDSQEFDPDLYERFSFYLSRGHSANEVAVKLRVSANVVSRYLQKQPDSVMELAALQRNIKNLLMREEDLEFPFRDPLFQKTSVARGIWQVLQLSHEDHDLGLVIGDSGVGKTSTAHEYKRRHENTVLITLDVCTRSVTAVLWKIARHLTHTSHFHTSNSQILGRVCDAFRGSRRLLVVDESHFLAWEGFEALRRIHDSAQVGIVFLGMPRVYEAMRGTRSSYLYDQLYSRIGCKFHATGIEKADVQLIVDAICPNLPKACISLLFEVAQGAGRFRLMVKLLQKAIRIHKVEGVPITVELLKEVRSLLVL